MRTVLLPSFDLKWEEVDEITGTYSTGFTWDIPVDSEFVWILNPITKKPMQHPLKLKYFFSANNLFLTMWSIIQNT